MCDCSFAIVKKYQKYNILIKMQIQLQKYHKLKNIHVITMFSVIFIWEQCDWWCIRPCCEPFTTLAFLRSFVLLLLLLVRHIHILQAYLANIIQINLLFTWSLSIYIQWKISCLFGKKVTWDFMPEFIVRINKWMLLVTLLI